MQGNDTLRNLLIAAAVFVAVMAIVPRFLKLPPQTPQPAATERPTAPVHQDVSLQEGASEPDSTVATSTGKPTGATPTSGALVVVEAGEERELALGSAPTNGVEADSEESPYRMRLTLSNVGASVVSATATDHAETLEGSERYQLLAPVERDEDVRFRSLSVEKITIDDEEVVLLDKKWHTEGAEPCATELGDGECVRFWIDVREGDEPVVRVIRWFRLPRQAEKLHRHDLESEIVVENLSGIPRRVFLAYRGGLGLRHSNPRFPDQFIDWGVHQGGRVVGHRKTFADVSKNENHRIELYEPVLAAPGVGLSWAATGNTYFTCTIAPLDREGRDNADYLAQVAAIDVDGFALTTEDVTLRFLTVGEKLAKGESLHYPAAVYLGEKEINGFRVVDSYKQRNYYYQIAQGFGYCTFNWLVELMIWLLNSLFNVVRDFGVAIVILVLIVRTLLHPITKKGQVNMVRMQHRMQELAPKIEEIKKKYSNDKARMNEEMMKLNINPAGQIITCLPMVIQMPIWVALYISLSNNILMRHEGFLFTWIGDLTAQDALYTFSSPLHVPLFGWELTSFNLLPILVAIFMYTQQRLQPKPKPNPNMTDQQRQQQEMMQKMGPIMSIMMLLIFYKMPSGLNLYIMSSSLFGTIEQHRIRKHIKEREEAGTLHKPDKPKTPPDGMQRKPGKPSFIARLQKAAEDAQRNKFGDSRKPKKRR